MRGVSVLLVVIFTLGVVMIVGVAALESVGEHAKQRESLDSINGTEKINTTYDVVFKWMPLLFIGGFGVWGVAWYLRRERRPGGGFR